MTIVDDLIAEWKSERASLVRRLEMLENGKLRTGIPMGSTTGATIIRVKGWIAGLDDLLKKYARPMS